MASIIPRKGKKGTSYQVRWTETLSSGELRQRSETFSTRKQASAFINSGATAGPGAADPTATLADALDRWIDLAGTTGLRGREPVEKATLRTYRRHTEILKNSHGAVRLSDLDAPAAHRIMENLLDSHTRVYARKILVSLKSALAQAVRDGHLQGNPAADLRIMISSRHRANTRAPIPSIDEVRALLSRAEGMIDTPNSQLQIRWRRFHALFHTMVFSGMRPGEALGLPWRNVDFEGNTITIDQDATESHEIGMPKSASSYRDIHMPALAMDVLQAWRPHCPAGEHDLVFPNWQGNIESLGNITRRGWHPLQQRAGIVHPDEQGLRPKDGRPKYPLKSLRHVRASMEIAGGATALEVMNLMGHSSIKVTYDVYGHLFPEDDQDRRDRADRIAFTLTSPE
jgi:integrase